MPRNGSGVYTVPVTFVAGTRANAADVNEDMQDIGTALTDSLPRDGQAAMTGQFQSIDGTESVPGMSWASDPSTGIRRTGVGQMALVCSGSDVLDVGPTGITVLGLVQTFVGELRDFAGAVANIPNGWLPCDGTAISRSTYSLLFTAIGTTWGSGNGTTTFNIPDLRGRTTAHLDGGTDRLTTAGGGVDGVTLGAVGGDQNETIAQGNLPAVNLEGTGTPSVAGLRLNGVNTSSPSNGVQGGGSFNAFGQSSYGQADVMTVTTPLGGSGAALKVVQPTAMVNKIIFTGRATV